MVVFKCVKDKESYVNRITRFAEIVHKCISFLVFIILNLWCRRAFCSCFGEKVMSFCEILKACGDLFYWQANNLENTLHIPWVSLGYLHLLSVTSLDLLIVAKLQIFDNKIYGSVSAGRGEWLFLVLFFQKVKPPCDFTW